MNPAIEGSTPAAGGRSGEGRPMRMRFGRAWLWLGAIGALGCVMFAAQLVEGYIRRMPTGDQTGVALGLMFFELWLLPGATVPILLSAGARESLADPRQPEPGRAPGWAPVLLLASGWLLIGSAALCVAVLMPRSGGAGGAGPARTLYALSHAGPLVGLGAIWIGFGSAARRADAAPPPWLAPLLLLTAAGTLILDASMLIEGFHGAYPGADRWVLLVRNLLYFCTPSLVMVALMLQRAWTLVRPAAPARETVSR